MTLFPAGNQLLFLTGSRTLTFRGLDGTLTRRITLDEYAAGAPVMFHAVLCALNDARFEVPVGAVCTFSDQLPEVKARFEAAALLVDFIAGERRLTVAFADRAEQKGFLTTLDDALTIRSPRDSLAATGLVDGRREELRFLCGGPDVHLRSATLGRHGSFRVGMNLLITIRNWLHRSLDERGDLNHG